MEPELQPTAAALQERLQHTFAALGESSQHAWVISPVTVACAGREADSDEESDECEEGDEQRWAKAVDDLEAPLASRAFCSGLEREADFDDLDAMAVGSSLSKPHATVKSVATQRAGWTCYDLGEELVVGGTEPPSEQEHAVPRSLRSLREEDAAEEETLVPEQRE
jgi:hypothetical protein